MQRLTTRVFFIVMLILCPSVAFAQVQPQTCEEREILLREIVNQDTQMRRSVEIELAATKVQVRLLQAQHGAQKKEPVKDAP